MALIYSINFGSNSKFSVEIDESVILGLAEKNGFLSPDIARSLTDDVKHAEETLGMLVVENHDLRGLVEILVMELNDGDSEAAQMNIERIEEQLVSKTDSQSTQRAALFHVTATLIYPNSYTDSIELLCNAHELDRSNPRYAYDCAFASYHVGKLMTAKSVLEYSLSDSISTGGLAIAKNRILLSEVSLVFGEREHAIELLKEARKDLASKPKNDSLWVEFALLDVEANIDLARVHHLEDDFESAELYLTEAQLMLEKIGDQHLTDPEKKRDYAVELANVATFIGDYDHRLDTLEKAEELLTNQDEQAVKSSQRPYWVTDLPGINCSKSRVFYAMKDLDRAQGAALNCVSGLSKAHDQDNNNEFLAIYLASALRLLGNIELRRDNRSSALQAYNKMSLILKGLEGRILVDSSFRLSFYKYSRELAIALLFAGEDERAVELLQKIQRQSLTETHADNQHPELAAIHWAIIVDYFDVGVKSGLIEPDSTTEAALIQAVLALEELTLKFRKNSFVLKELVRATQKSVSVSYRLNRNDVAKVHAENAISNLEHLKYCNDGYCKSALRDSIIIFKLLESIGGHEKFFYLRKLKEILEIRIENFNVEEGEVNLLSILNERL